METAFPGSSKTPPKFALSLIELQAGQTATIAGVGVQAFQMQHGTPGGPFLAYRLVVEGRTIAYSGDTEWTDELVRVRTTKSERCRYLLGNRHAAA